MTLMGKLPIKNPINYYKIIRESKYLWQIKNEFRSPFIVTVLKEKKTQKQIRVLLTKNGKVIIIGARSTIEGKKVFNKIKKELESIKRGDNIAFPK